MRTLAVSLTLFAISVIAAVFTMFVMAIWTGDTTFAENLVDTGLLGMVLATILGGGAGFAWLAIPEKR